MIRVNGKPFVPQYFPDGTFRLYFDGDDSSVEVEWLYESNEELIAIHFLVNHMREVLNVGRITLRLPYIPNARMDRTKDSSEVFTLKYFCRFINDLEFDKVIVRDAHSNVSLALLNRVEWEDIGVRLRELSAQLLVDDQDIVFFPDEGARNRYSEYFQRRYLFAVKQREWKTGKIVSLDVVGEVPAHRFNALIVDDICSYGGTFYHSAKKLKELGADKIWLYVTHCENNILNRDLLTSGLVEMVYTTESIYRAEHPLIQII